jgi:serine/threonine protein phosphatase 1
VVGSYLFVHAGVRRGRPLAEQSAQDLLWTRRGWADREEPTEHVVVHGHTPVAEPFLGRYRINLDTGAYASSRLSCVMLRSTMRKLIEV